jgi:uncharacterized protein (DUF488 family)
LQNDLEVLCKNGILSCEDEKYFCPDCNLASITLNRKKELDNVVDKFGKYQTNDLVKYVYIKYPDYAINSIKADDLQNRKQLAVIAVKKKKEESPALFTIGYEHKSIDKYLRQLIEHNVKLLIDVRAHSFSMKREFIGNKLSSACKLVNIDYIHIPELGKPNQYRREITDKKKLFEMYQTVLLHQHNDQIQKVTNLMDKNHRIALTCFEAEEKECHRSVLAELIAVKTKQSFVVEHI